jgi:hypothetical protein
LILDLAGDAAKWCGGGSSGLNGQTRKFGTENTAAGSIFRQAKLDTIHVTAFEDATLRHIRIVYLGYALKPGIRLQEGQMDVLTCRPISLFGD